MQIRPQKWICMRSIEHSKGLSSPGSSRRFARIDNKAKPGIALLFTAALLTGFPNRLSHEPNLVLWMGRVQSNMGTNASGRQIVFLAEEPVMHIEIVGTEAPSAYCYMSEFECPASL
uniref:Secreted protein n=1 Tax=Panagrellus redivivus TaxID=6233 RepID=A0A7E4WBG6_PANRE